jgi:hypothetical protein
MRLRVDHLLYGSALRDGIMVGGCVGFGAKKRDTRRRKHLLCRGGSLARSLARSTILLLLRGVGVARIEFSLPLALPHHLCISRPRPVSDATSSGMQAAEWLTARLMRSLPGLFAAKKNHPLKPVRQHRKKKLRAKVIQIDRH